MQHTMTKAQFLAHVAAIYRLGNLSDSDSPDRADWTRPEMAAGACCGALDDMLRAMVECGALTADEKQELYDTL